VHVLVVQTKRDTTVTMHWTDEDARAELARFVQQAWQPRLAEEPMPADPTRRSSAPSHAPQTTATSSTA